MVAMRLSFRRQHGLGRGRLQHADAEGLAADLVFLAVHPQKLGVGELRHVRFRGEHLGGVGGDVDAQVLGQHLGHGTVGFGRGGGAEFQRVAEDAGQHRALHRVGHFRRVIAHQVVHDRGGAGDGPHGDVDRPLRLKPADQLVVVDDRADVGGVHVRGQFGGVVGVDDDDGLPGLDAVDDGGLVQTPARQHEGGLGVRFAEEDRRRLFACDFAQVPGPDDRGAGAVRVGGFVAENEGGHWGLFGQDWNLRPS
jgi:hypothetical protein